MRTKTLLTALTAAAFVGSTQAATVLDTGFNINNDDSPVTDAELGNLDFTGASKLVVTIGIEGIQAGPGTVSYNGTEMTLAVTNGSPANNWGWVGVYYLDNPGLIGVGDLTAGSAAGYGYSFGVSAMVLGGTAAGAGNTAATADGTTVALNASADSVVVTAFVDGSEGTGSLAAPYNTVMNGAFGSALHMAGYYEVPSAGEQNPTFTATGVRNNTVATEFLAVPEPGSLALLGLGGLLVASRRRRG